jgi:hypothetical protein
MPIKILGQTRDLRTNTVVIYGQATIRDYLDLVGNDFDQFDLQRTRQKHKAYHRLADDIQAGAVLPSITLAVKADRVNQILGIMEKDSLSMYATAEALSEPGHAFILDGLQRTHILKDLANGGFEFDEKQSLLLEFWLEPSIKHLIYRMIVLNSGQKPMSLRHQIELMFMSIQADILQSVDDIEIYRERDETKRRGPRKYALNRLTMALNCMLSESPEAEKENMVAQALDEAAVLDSTEDALNSKYGLFKELLAKYADLDEEICRIYAERRSDLNLPTGANWFGSENVLNAMFAAVGMMHKRGAASSVWTALATLDKQLKASAPGDDPMGLAGLTKVFEGVSSRKVNVGVNTRRVLFDGFRKYFLDEGLTSLEKCWRLAA